MHFVDIVFCKNKIANIVISKRISNTCCISCIKKFVSKIQLNTCFELESNILLQQIFRNIFYCCRLLFSSLQSSCFLQFSCFLLLLLSRNSKKQFKNNIQNIVLDNKIVVLCFRVKTIVKKIIAQKQIVTTKESLTI